MQTCAYTCSPFWACCARAPPGAAARAAATASSEAVRRYTTMFIILYPSGRFGATRSSKRNASAHRWAGRVRMPPNYTALAVTIAVDRGTSGADALGVVRPSRVLLDLALAEV